MYAPKNLSEDITSISKSMVNNIITGVLEQEMTRTRKTKRTRKTTRTKTLLELEKQRTT